MKKIFSTIIVLFGICLAISGCSLKKNDTIVNKESTIVKQNEVLSLKAFIPTKSYKVVFDGTDLAPNIQYIRGNGTKYQTVGCDGRGSFVNVYALEKEGINCIKEYNELSTTEEKHLDKVDFLDKNEQVDKTLMLWEPLRVDSKVKNSKIVEVGKDLKLDKLQLKGSYVKIEQRTEGSSADDKTIITSYYSEGLGRVKYEVRMGETDVCHYVMKDYMEMK